MATLPFVGPALKPRKPLTGARMIIVASAIGFALFLIWASIAQVDEVTRGQGKVIPSSKLQIITAAEPATVSEILVKSGQQVKKAQLLARLDSPESRQVQAETESLQARIARLTAAEHRARAAFLHLKGSRNLSSPTPATRACRCGRTAARSTR